MAPLHSPKSILIPVNGLHKHIRTRPRAGCSAPSQHPPPAAVHFSSRLMRRHCHVSPDTACNPSVLQVFTFIGVSVTNVLAVQSPTAPGIPDAERRRRAAAWQKLQSVSLLGAAVAGAAVTAACLLFSRPLLRLMGAPEATLALALPYLRTRCLSAPAVMLMNASQGIFLAQQDTLTPLKIFLAAAACNAALCAALVLGLGLGLLGAATATFIVQVRPSTPPPASHARGPQPAPESRRG